MNRPNIDRLDTRVREIYRELAELVDYTLHVESRLEAAHRAVTKIAVFKSLSHSYQQDVEVMKLIANDALAAWGREPEI